MFLCELNQLLTFPWPPAKISYWRIRDGRALLRVHLNNARQQHRNMSVWVQYWTKTLGRCQQVSGVCVFQRSVHLSGCSERAVDEVTVAYIMYEMSHRFSWNQLLIIASDRVVHPQSQHWATGAETRWISFEKSQSCIAKTLSVFPSTCDILHTWQHAEMDIWGAYMVQWSTCHGRMCIMFL